MQYQDRPERFPTFIPVVVGNQSRQQCGSIVDINALGAGILGISELKVGDKIQLRGAVETCVATVRWHAGDRCGVSFDAQLPPEHLAMLRMRSTVYTGPTTGVPLAG